MYYNGKNTEQGVRFSFLSALPPTVPLDNSLSFFKSNFLPHASEGHELIDFCDAF